MWKQIRSGLAIVFFLVSCQAAPTSPTATATVAAGPVCFSPADIIAVSFTPDSKMLAIRTGSGVQFFNLETRKEERFIQSPKPILSATLSPDGKLLAWSFEDHSLQLVQASDGKVVNTMTGHTDIVFKLRFSATGDRLFTGSHDGTVRVWDSKGELIKVVETGGEVLGMGVSSDGSKLATIPSDGAVQLWDLTDYHKLSDVGGTGGFDTSDAVFSPDGNYLAADLVSGLYIWRLSDGKSLWDSPKNSLAVTYSPDGKYLAYADVNQNNQIVLSSADGAEVIRTIEGTRAPVWELFFSPDGSLLAGNNDMEIRIWRVDDGKLLYFGKASCP
jgi:WD40 repeat protein